MTLQLLGSKTNIGLLPGIVLSALLLALIDQWIKGLVVNGLTLNESRPFINGVLWLSYRQNSGVAFSLLQTAPPWIIIAINLLVTAMIGYIVFTIMQRRYGMLTGALLLGGALSNLYDRLHRHYVVDYLDFRFWPVFNLADICIFSGMICLFLLIATDHQTRGKSSGENVI